MNSAMNPANDLHVAPLGDPDPLARVDLFRALEHRYLVWDAFVGGVRRVDLHPLVLNADAHQRCVQTACDAWSLVSRASDYAFAEPRERARYDLPADVERLAAASHVAGDRASLVRVDLLQREDGRFIACEVNADCPGGHNEALALPELARQAGAHDGEARWSPRPAVLDLADALVAASGGPGSPRGLVALVFATGYYDDLQVCALVERLVRERGGRTVRLPITALAARGDRIVARREGEPIAVLYRYYPAEVMAGLGIIEGLANALEAKTLVTFSSFATIYAQSKLAMARAFAIDPVAASKTFPATLAFGDADIPTLLRERARWVVKRDLSRVGDHVALGELFSDEDFALALKEIEEAEKEGEVWIAQRFVPQRMVPTRDGPRYLTLGVYLFDGRFAGYYARLSKTTLCTHDALAVPVFVEGTP